MLIYALCFAANFGPWELGPQHGFARNKTWKSVSDPVNVSGIS